MSTSKWGTYAEAVAAVHGGNPHLVTVLNVTKIRHCPPPPWDPGGVYQVTLAGGTPVIQRLAEDTTWVAAPLQPPSDHMSEAQKKLAKLKDRLEATEASPWSNIEAWISSATPLIKMAYRDFYDDFATLTAEPKWSSFPRASSGGGRHGPRRDNFARAAAGEEKENRRKSEGVKTNFLAFLDGLLDLPPAAEPRPSGHSVVGGHTIHANGDVNFGTSTKTSFKNSRVGAAATAPAAVATAEQHTVECLKEAVKAVQQALVAEQDDIHELLHEALWKLLTSVRKIEIKQADQANVITRIKASVDDIWVANELQGMKVPAGSEIAKAILASPVLAAGLKGIIAVAV